MTAKERIMAILLENKLQRYRDYAKTMGVLVEIKGRTRKRDLENNA